MTGGVVVILGSTGRNFGAGMTGGTAYVWDPDGSFRNGQKFHPEFVEPKPLDECSCPEQAALRELLHQHVAKTGSQIGEQLIQNWPQTIQQVLSIAPRMEPAN
jgi:glutamate synthase domain-containing protein 3